MRDAPWIEKAERYGCEYMHDFIWGKPNEDDDIYYEDEDDDYDYEDEEDENYIDCTKRNCEDCEYFCPHCGNCIIVDEEEE